VESVNEVKIGDNSSKVELNRKREEETDITKLALAKYAVENQSLLHALVFELHGDLDEELELKL
jgi:hypothetical protein